MTRALHALVGCALVGAQLGAVSASWGAEPRGQQSSAVQRGRYLVMLGGCNDCHSPKLFTAQGPKVDEKRVLSGHPAGDRLPPVPANAIGPGKWGALASGDMTAWVGPWGTSFAANLTPDATGLGNWTQQMFIRALRTGKHAGEGRPVLPPMPWEDIGKLTDADLRAIFAYLKSLPPIPNPVPAPVAPVGSPG